MKNTLFNALAAGLLFAATAEASTNFFTFNSDPASVLTIYRVEEANSAGMAGAWFPTGGSPNDPVDPSINGYLQITAGANPSPSAFGHRAVIVFDDFDAGLVVAGFKFSCDVRIGAGTDTPADGFSINYARANDPVIVQANGNGFACHAAGCGTEENLPEEGTQTGLSICFDAWDSGAPDVIGLTIRVDNTIVTNLAMPTLNGDCTDPTSLQTGPNTGGLGALCWQPLAVELTTSGQLTVRYKGVTFLSNFPVPFAPGPGRLIFGGRVGGANQFQHIDNIRIETIPAAKPVIALLGSDINANGFRYTINDSGAAVPDTNTITVQLDGLAVTPTSITRNPPITVVTYQNPNLIMVSGSSHTASIQFTGFGFTGMDSATNTFAVPAYTLLTTAHQAPGAVNTSLSGFTGRIHQLPVARTPDAGSLIGIERQLADGYIDPATGQPYASTTVGGVSNFTAEVINWGQDILFSGASVGDFRQDAAPPADWKDDPIPGTDRPSADPDNLAAELLTVLDLTPGSYQFAVNHDDGFKLTAGAEPRDTLKATLLATDAGAVNTAGIKLTVAQAGKYPFRLVWGENGGGAQLEFYLIDFNTGQKVLVNNRTNPVNIVAYRDTAALTQPFVRWTSPAPGEKTVNPDAAVIVKLDDGSAATINDSSISVKVNGLGGTTTHTRSGGEVMATLPSAGTLASGSTNTVTLIYSTSAGGPFTNTWTFAAATFETLPVSLRTATGSGSDPGFRIRTWQLDTNHLVNVWGYPPNNIGSGNDIYEAGMLFTGLWGQNMADTSGFDGNGEYAETGVINYRATAGGVLQAPLSSENDVGTFTAANGHADAQVPGITASQAYPSGGPDNVAMIANCFVEFPAAGYYQMGVNSDDGFEVTVGDSEKLAGHLHITAPAAIAREYAFQPNDAFLPPMVTPISRPVVLCDPPTAEDTLNNAGAIAGNIAFFSRNAITNYNTGKGGSAARVQRCFDAGAVGVIEYVAPGQFPFNIALATNLGPFAMLSFGDGTNILAHVTANASSPVFATFSGGDQAQVLGVFNGGRGQGTPTMFGIVAPQPGLHPVRLLWENGGGDASVEWFTQDASGGRHLVNDTSDPAALKAYRSRTVAGGAPRLNLVPLPKGVPTVSWTGVGELQNAGRVTGPFIRAAGQDNPHTNAPLDAQRYFRIRQY